MNKPEAPKLKIFGISGKLGEFCTSEKDLQRTPPVNRMPNDFYSMNDMSKKGGNETALNDDDIDELADDFFGFEVLAMDKEAIEQ